VTDPLPAAPDEAWGIEWGAADGNGGFVRLALHRAARVAWFWAYLLRPVGGPVVVRDHEVTLPRGAALEIRADALWAELVCETPGEHWSIGLEAFGVRLDEPEDALYGEIGERIALGFDFEWETAGAPYRSTRGDVVREEQPGTVRGEILLGRERIPLDTAGWFGHSTGPHDTTNPSAGATRSTVAWDDGSWWSLRSVGGARSGARWEGGVVHEIDGSDAAAATGPEVSPRSVAMIPLGDLVVTRGLGAATAAGRRGTGWMESVSPLRAKIP
jgi:hypothetical protein